MAWNFFFFLLLGSACLGREVFVEPVGKVRIDAHEKTLQQIDRTQTHILKATAKENLELALAYIKKQYPEMRLDQLELLSFNYRLQNYAPPFDPPLFTCSLLVDFRDNGSLKIKKDSPQSTDWEYFSYTADLGFNTGALAVQTHFNARKLKGSLHEEKNSSEAEREAILRKPEKGLFFSNTKAAPLSAWRGFGKGDLSLSPVGEIFFKRHMATLESKTLTQERLVSGPTCNDCIGMAMALIFKKYADISPRDLSLQDMYYSLPNYFSPRSPRHPQCHLHVTFIETPSRQTLERPGQMTKWRYSLYQSDFYSYPNAEEVYMPVYARKSAIDYDPPKAVSE